MLSFSCRLTLDDLQSRTCSVGRLENPDATDISDTSAIMSIRLKLLLTTLIYPAIQPGHRSGLESCRYLAPGRCLCSLFAACFRGGATISLPYLGTAHDLLCPLLTSVTRWAHLSVRSVLGAPSKMTLHSSGLFPVWTASGCIDSPRVACFAFLARRKNVRFRCDDSFC